MRQNITIIPLKIPNRWGGLESSRELPIKFESAPTEGADSNLRWSKSHLVRCLGSTNWNFLCYKHKFYTL